MKLLKEFTDPYIKDKQWSDDQRSYKAKLKKYLKSGSPKDFDLLTAIRYWKRHKWTQEWIGEDGTFAVNFRPDEQLMMKYIFGLDDNDKNYLKELNKYPKPKSSSFEDKMIAYTEMGMHIDHYLSFVDHYLNKEYAIKLGNLKRDDDDAMRFFEDLTKADLLVIIQCMKSAMNKQQSLIQRLHVQHRKTKQESIIRYRKWKAYQGVLAVILEMPNPVLDKLVDKARGRGMKIIKGLAEQQKQLK